MKEKLNKEFIINLSKKKQEPSWMLEHRLQSYENFLSQDEPNFGPDIHINFDSKIDDTSFKRDLAFSYDENYNLKMGKFKMTIKVDNDEELYTETTVETLIPCEEQIFDIRKDYEEETKYRFFIFIVS